jgi:hypothetical protein
MDSVPIESLGVRPTTVRWATPTRSHQSNAVGVLCTPNEYGAGDERVASEFWMDAAHIARRTGSSM